MGREIIGEAGSISEPSSFFLENVAHKNRSFPWNVYVPMGGYQEKMSERNAGLVRNAVVMMMGTATSRILGLVREVLVAAFFGATRQLDAFNIAYTIANLARQLLAEGALSAAFVPVFSRVLRDKGPSRAGMLARRAVFVLLVFGGMAVGLGLLLAPLLVRILALGFGPEERALAVDLTRSMFPYLLIVSLSALAMGVLNSMNCFFIPAVAPALSNVTFILVLAFSAKQWGLWALPGAVLLGGVMHCALQWIWAWKLGMPLFPAKPSRDDEDLRHMLALFLPYAAGLSLNQLHPVISRLFGSFLEGGAISALNYADRVLQLPLGLFVIAISQAVLPMLSRLDPHDTEGFLEALRDAVRFALFVVLPVSMGGALYAGETVHLLFFRGAFGEWAWHATTAALGFYALGLPGMTCTTVMMRALYARTLPRDAIRVTVASIGANLVISAVLLPFLSFRGLALASSCAFTVSAVVGYHRLVRHLGCGMAIFSRSWLMRMGWGLMVTFGILEMWRWGWPYPLEASTAWRSAWLGGASVLGGGTYLLTMRALGCPEWQWLQSAVSRRERKEGAL